MDQEVAKTLGELELKLQELERELTTIGHRDTPAEPPHAPGKLIDEAVERDRERKIDAEPSAEEQAAAEGDGFGGPPVFGGEEIPAQAGATIERDWTVEARETAYGEIPTPPSPPTPPPTPPLSPPLPPPLSPPSGATPQPPRSTPPGPIPPATSSGPPPHSAAPGYPPPSTPPGSHAPSSPPGMHAPSSPPGIHPPASPPGSHLPPPHRPDPRYPAAVEESQSIDLAELVRFREKLASTMDALIDEYSRLLSVEPPSRPRPGA